MNNLFRGAARLMLLPCLLLPAGALAQDTLPPAATLVERYVQAIGGKEILQRKNSIHITATLEAMGMTGEMEIMQMKPDRLVTRLTFANLGEIRSGYDGTVGWSTDPMQGPRILQEDEKDQLRDQATWGAMYRSPELIDSMRTLERSEVAGEACYRVHIAWKSGRETHDCYSTDTGLLVGTVAEQRSQMGTVQVETHLESYQEFGGVRFPSRMNQLAMGQRHVITINSIQFDSLDESAFVPPPEIRTLVEQRGN